MEMAPPTLDRQSWITAALRALLRDGPSAVAVEPLARSLAATKGSFYWHFHSRDELLEATLDEWIRLTTDDVIAAMDELDVPPAERARRLFAMVIEASERHPGQLVLLASADHPSVAAALDRATRRRIDYVAHLLRSAGLAAPIARRRAILAYAAYLGWAQLAHTTPGVLPRRGAARRALRDEMSQLLAPDNRLPGRRNVDKT